jgi:hypothetical protein
MLSVVSEGNPRGREGTADRSRRYNRQPNLEVAMLAIRYAALAAALLLAACGSSKTDRGLSGGAIGAGTGAALGAVTGTSTLGGAVLGGAAGAATGVFTDEDDVDLGEPIWK